MGTTAIISASIAVSGFIIGIITTVARLAGRFAKMEQRLQTDEENAKEKRSELHALSCRQADYSATQAAILARLDAISEDLKELKNAMKK